MSNDPKRRPRLGRLSKVAKVPSENDSQSNHSESLKKENEEKQTLQHRENQSALTQRNPTQPNATQPRYRKNNTVRVEESGLARDEVDVGQSEQIQIRMAPSLTKEIENVCNGARNNGDFSTEFANVAAFCRHALNMYRQTGRLTRIAESKAGSRKARSLRVTSDLKAWWIALPKTNKPEILERAVRTRIADLLAHPEG